VVRAAVSQTGQTGFWPVRGQHLTRRGGTEPGTDDGPTTGPRLECHTAGAAEWKNCHNLDLVTVATASRQLISGFAVEVGRFCDFFRHWPMQAI
jgi:hypothetical protein